MLTPHQLTEGRANPCQPCGVGDNSTSGNGGVSVGDKFMSTDRGDGVDDNSSMSADGGGEVCDSSSGIVKRCSSSRQASSNRRSCKRLLVERVDRR